MSFQQGLSGLDAAAKNLDVVGNNVANANTVGFKGANAEFADVYANSLGGGGGVSVGIGTALSAVQQTFAQGNIEVSNNPLDLAINGQGFFRMSNNGTVTYSRNGQFSLDKSGFVVNANNEHLTGYAATASGAITTSTPVDLQLSQADISPQATSKTQVVANLDSTSSVLPATSFNPADPTTFTSSTSMSTFDTLGNAHTLSLYFLKSTANTWQVFAAQDAAATGAASPSVALPAFVSTAGGSYTLNVGGVSVLAAAAAPVSAANIDTAITAASAALTAAGISTSGTAAGGTLKFNKANGTSVTVSETLGAGATAGGFFGGSAAGTLSQTFAAAFAGGVAPVGVLKFLPSGAIDTASTTLPFSISAPVTTGATSPLAYTLDFTGTTQFGSPFGVNLLTQDGYTSGRLSGFSIGNDGVILGRYSNGQSRAQGQVVLANFTDPNGLQPLGNNNWGDTPQSGGALIGVPGTSSLGVLQSGAVEDSNVDLTAELVKMITAQRVYQANAQSIKTQDQVLQTLVNMR